MAAKVRHIEGHIYHLQGIAKTKAQANDEAYLLRNKHGDNCRVFKVKEGYALYSK